MASVIVRCHEHRESGPPRGMILCACCDYSAESERILDVARTVFGLRHAVAIAGDWSFTEPTRYRPGERFDFQTEVP